jgi:hypothetical protein
VARMDGEVGQDIAPEPSELVHQCGASNRQLHVLPNLCSMHSLVTSEALSKGAHPLSPSLCGKQPFPQRDVSFQTCIMLEHVSDAISGQCMHPISCSPVPWCRESGEGRWGLIWVPS